MRSIDADIIAQLQAGELRPFYMLDMNIDGEHCRYTDCDVPLVLSGEIYQPLGFRVEPMRYSSGTIVDETKIEIDTLDEVMTRLFVGGTPQESEVVISLVVLKKE